MFYPSLNVASFFLFLRGGWGGFPGTPLPILLTFIPQGGVPTFRVRQCPFLPPPFVSLWVALSLPSKQQLLFLPTAPASELLPDLPLLWDQRCGQEPEGALHLPPSWAGLRGLETLALSAG